MNVRAKFKVEKVTHFAYNCYRNSVDSGVPAREVTLSPQYDKSNPEDVSFSEATPTGSIVFLLTNPDLKDEFQPGTTYYVDFTPAQ